MNQFRKLLRVATSLNKFATFHRFKSACFKLRKPIISSFIATSFAITLASAEEQTSSEPYPFFSISEIESHNAVDKGIWVTYKDGVYDVTNFINSHPGGADKIMLAGDSIVRSIYYILLT